MTRYYRQRDRYSCGPVAFYNARKWMGMKGSWNKEKYYLKMMCNCWLNGTYPVSLHMAMKIVHSQKIGRLHKKPKLSWIDKQLELGRAIVIRFFHDADDERKGHFILLVGQTSKTYQVVGWQQKITTQKIYRHTIATSLRLKREASSSIAWTIKR